MAVDSLSINPQITKEIFEIIKKGNIEEIITSIEQMGIDVTHIFEKDYKHNVIFKCLAITDEEAMLKLIQIFIDRGVPANYTDTLGQTALYYASRDGRNEVVKLLLEHGCNPNHLDTYG